MSNVNSKFRMAIVGPKEVTQGFEALGFTAVNAINTKEATEQLFALKKETQTINGEEKPLYAVIFVLEEVVQEIAKDDYAKLTAHALPAIIALPGPEGSTGFGLKRLKSLVERAVGQDILGD